MSRTKKNLRLFFNHTSTCLLFLLNPLFFFYYQEATKSVHKSDEINVVSLARPNNETEFIDLNFKSYQRREKINEMRGLPPHLPINQQELFNMSLAKFFEDYKKEIINGPQKPPKFITLEDLARDFVIWTETYEENQEKLHDIQICIKEHMSAAKLFISFSLFFAYIGLVINPIKTIIELNSFGNFGTSLGLSSTFSNSLNNPDSSFFQKTRPEHFNSGSWVLTLMTSFIYLNKKRFCSGNLHDFDLLLLILVFVLQTMALLLWWYEDSMQNSVSEQFDGVKGRNQRVSREL